MHNVLRFLLQLMAYAAFAVVVGYLSFWPKYQYASPDLAVIKLSLSHAAERVEPCVQLTPQQIAELAPNMRRTEACERKRLPLALELELDGEIVVQLQAEAAGLWEDGPASIYERFDVPPGSHHITARLRDSARTSGWDYTYNEDVELEAGRYLTITFKAETGGFAIR